MSELERNAELQKDLNEFLSIGTYYQVLLEGGAFTFEIGYMDYYEGMYWRNFGSFESVEKVNKFMQKILRVLERNKNRSIKFDNLITLLAKNGINAYE